MKLSLSVILALFAAVEYVLADERSTSNNDDDTSEDEVIAPSRQRRSVVRSYRRRWTNGVVPYEFHKNVNYATRALIKDAMGELERLSCVRFQKRKFERDYLFILHGRGCSSVIGRLGGRQQITLGFGCHKKGIIMHELMHTLGFFHEHTRTDRDDHVTINHDNIQTMAKRQFRKHFWLEGTTLGEPYDPESIMHYENYAFTKNGRRTMELKEDPSKILGQRHTLSRIDKRQLNKLYNCMARPTHPQSYITNPTKSQVTTSKVIPKAICRDRNAFVCTIYKMMGHCEKPGDVIRMRETCPRTCALCSGGERVPCKDTSRYCRFVKEKRQWYCVTSATVRKNCRQTCKQC